MVVRGECIMFNLLADVSSNERNHKSRSRLLRVCSRSLVFYVVSRKRAQKALKEQKTHANYRNFNWSLMHSLSSCFQERSRLNEFENILMRNLLTTLVSMAKFSRDNEHARKLTLACFLRRKSYRFTCGDAGKINEKHFWQHLRF